MTGDGDGGEELVSEVATAVAAAAACSHAPTDNNLLKFNALFTADWPQFVAPPPGGQGQHVRRGEGAVPPLECVQYCAVTCPR